jgi:16S rRNA G966 N2-methylase RsmD
MELYSRERINVGSNRLKTLFPPLKNREMCKLKLDKVSLYSISSDKVSRLISETIYNFIQTKDIVITDATSGVGGNTISFAKYFSKVNAIEKDTVRFDYLKNNIDIYDLTDKVTFYNADYLDLKDCLKQDVIFIDPPWGGRDYKRERELDLYLSDIELSEVCNSLAGMSRIIVLKVPINFNSEGFYKKLNRKEIPYLYRLSKMDIIIINNF